MATTLADLRPKRPITRRACRRCGAPILIAETANGTLLALSAKPSPAWAVFGKMTATSVDMYVEHDCR